MPFSGMLRHMALVRTNVSEERSTSIITVTRIGGLVCLHSIRQLLVTANVVPSSQTLVTLMMEVLCSSKTSVLTTATWRNISEDSILHSYHCENLKPYTEYIWIEKTKINTEAWVENFNDKRLHFETHLNTGG
jgi:hypothetical protein